MVEKLKKMFEPIPYLSATSDLWSRGARNYIAVNVHYIHAGTGKLETVLIACERFRGRRVHTAVAEKLKNIFSRYGIISKLVAITTDGGGEFKCAARKFGDNYQSFEPLLVDREDDDCLFHDDDFDQHPEHEYARANEIIELNEEGNSPLMVHEEVLDADSSANGIDSDSDYDFMGSDDDEEMLPFGSGQNDNFIVHNLFRGESLISEVRGSALVSQSVFLPSRIDCGAHGLNCIGKTDSFQANAQSEPYHEMYTAVFMKLNKIWTKSTQKLGKEVFDVYLGNRRILKPHRIRWNRIYDAVSIQENCKLIVSVFLFPFQNYSYRVVLISYVIVLLFYFNLD